MTTMKDVANITGLSVGTISNYINGKSVKNLNQDIIKNTIEELGYKPNFAGKSLRTGKTKTIGILANTLSSHFISESCFVIEKELYNHGYNVIFCTSNNDLETEREKLFYLASSNVAIIILIPVSHSETDISCVGNIPTLVIDSNVEHQNCNAILFDDKESAYNATKYFYNNGHRKIAFLAGTKGHFTSSNRLEGYKKALNDFGIPYNEEYVTYADYDELKAEISTINLFSNENPPTAVLIASNEMLIGFLLGLKAKKKRVPDDVSYITFDDTDYYSLLNIAPTYVKQPKYDFGMRVYETLVEILNPNSKEKEPKIKGKEPKIKYVKTSLIIGESVRNLNCDSVEEVKISIF